VVYVVNTTLDPAYIFGPMPTVSNTATADVINGIDMNVVNNTDTDTDPIIAVLFEDGFEE
jgi:hypothetical protein